eukprot:4262085-Amphidinium_carterae.1
MRQLTIRHATRSKHKILSKNTVQKRKHSSFKLKKTRNGEDQKGSEALFNGPWWPSCLQTLLLVRGVPASKGTIRTKRAAH